MAKCYLELALVHGKKKEFTDAINFQAKAHDIFKSLDKFINTEFLAQIAITLSEFQDKADMLDEAVSSLFEARNIYEDNFTLVDKRTCKVKRNIALLYVRMNHYQEALSEL